MKSQAHQTEATSPDPGVADERRASTRFSCNLETSCQPVAEAVPEAWPARAVDLSASGVALVLCRRFEPGALLTVRLESPDREISRTVLLRVVHSTPELDGSWRMGCSLAGQLGQEELRAFRAEHKLPSEPDCRAYVRFACDVETPCHSMSPGQPGSWSARVLDVSPGGMSLLVPRSFERGTLLSIELPGNSKGNPRRVMVRVLRDRPLGSNLRILGCELADQFSAEDLRRFQ